MPDKLKDTLFSHQALGQFAAAIQEAYPPFDDDHFLRLVFDEAWTERELKERLSHITECLRQTLQTTTGSRGDPQRVSPRQGLFADWSAPTMWPVRP